MLPMRFILFMALCACLGCGTNTCPSPPLGPLSHSMYVWQRMWVPEVATAVEQAASKACCFMVLAGELERENDRLHYVGVRADWQALAASGRSVWLVFRSCTGLTDAGAPLEREFMDPIQGTLDAVKRYGLTVTGLQLDYDCPTAELQAYTALLERIREVFPDVPLSITALPTWLPQAEFSRLVRGLDHFVLQVHGLERPRDRDSMTMLCDTEKINDWVERANRCGTPYYVALPTYGYRVFFNEAGAFAAIGAETLQGNPAGWTYKDLHADPAALAGVVRSLAVHRPPHCRGIVWFRLPIVSDTFNWSWPVLETVMAGKAPDLKVQAEIRTPREHLFEVWVQNLGDYQPPGIRIPVTGKWDVIRASDAVNGFHVQVLNKEKQLEITGPAPGHGEAKLAAWWVEAPEPGQESMFSVMTVEVLP